MRLYIGIPAIELKNPYLQFKKNNLDIPIDWFHPDDLHITLIPPFSTENKRGEIRKLGIFANKFKSINIALPEVESKKSFVWAFGPPNNGLQEIKDELEKHFKSEKTLMYKERTEEFIPHVTLARYKNMKEPIKKRSVGWNFKAEKIALYESVPLTTRRDKGYRILSEIKLND
ncbi:MAG: 2'-5' RNA ligase family protein [Patescibacteria group bacterium]